MCHTIAGLINNEMQFLYGVTISFSTFTNVFDIVF